MSQHHRFDAASEQLDRVHGLFSRIDDKASFLFAFNTGLAALLCLNIRPADLQAWYMVVPAATALVMIVASLHFVYRASFPNLRGGNDSLFYFREIARRTEARFIDDFTNETDDKFLRDLLGQVWRNSEILKAKFEAIERAFLLSAIALLPWTTFLTLVAIHHGQLPLFK